MGRDDPSALKANVSDDEGLKKLCIDLHFAKFVIQTDERGHRKLFREPVDAKFIADWRDYEKRWDAILSDIAWDEICIGVDLPAVPNTQAKDPFTLLWQAADEDAREAVAGFDAAMEQAADSVAVGDFPEGHPESIERAIFEFRQLRRKAGLNLRGILRRRGLVPVVLIPTHVAGRHGKQHGPQPDNKISLLLQLQQAQEAFVFGVPLAAISLMRALTELVLVYHYDFSAGDLADKINRLCDEKTKNPLHRLRKLANDILHYGDSPANGRESEFEQKRRQAHLGTLATYAASLTDGEPSRIEVDLIETEKDLISYLLALRYLIEEAPTHATARR
ncbi:MAG: hypothetical protein ACR65T_14815 [Methylocystis sp.]|uniref:hypothetical protein n=1 Tax=Methylocystis sp. TaxID=1911079 RepID=UPI003DA4EB86